MKHQKHLQAMEGTSKKRPRPRCISTKYEPPLPELDTKRRNKKQRKRSSAALNINRDDTKTETGSKSKKTILRGDSILQFGALMDQAKTSNFVFSPLSIRLGLSLVAAAGVLNEVELAQMLPILGSPTLSELNDISARLVHSCCCSSGDNNDRSSGDDADSSSGADNNNKLKISLANGIWTDRSTDLDPSAESIYKALVKRVDFKKKATRVRREINAWIEKETDGLIKDLLPEGFVNERTSCVLANALYFKGIWKNGPFGGCNTTGIQNFSLLDGSIIKVPLMTSGKTCQFYSSFKGFKVLSLRYAQPFHFSYVEEDRRRFSMHFFLPDKKDGLIDLSNRMASDPSFIDRYVPNTRVELKLIQIPKFKISANFSLNDPLKKMGLDVHRLNTIHGVTIEVDENGTTAAAATVVGLLRSALAKKRPIPPPTEIFVADHPFLFAIREDVSGAILFLGHVLNPLVEN